MYRICSRASIMLLRCSTTRRIHYSTMRYLVIELVFLKASRVNSRFVINVSLRYACLHVFYDKSPKISYVLDFRKIIFQRSALERADLDRRTFILSEEPSFLKYIKISRLKVNALEVRGLISFLLISRLLQSQRIHWTGPSVGSSLKLLLYFNV